MAGADAVQASWGATAIRARLAVLKKFRRALAERASEAARAAARAGVSEADILVAEVMPLLAACRFLEQRATAILAPRRPRAGRPAWLFGTTLEVRRLPMGRVLVIGPGNYPLLLPGVHLLQALAAGNAVRVKPAPGRAAPMHAVAALLAEAGLPRGVLAVLDDSAASGAAAVSAGADLIVLTGSSATGRTVLATAARTLTPCIMELSGDDPFIVLADADLAYAARALKFGQEFNAGETCIAPRRVIVEGGAEAGFRAAMAAIGITAPLIVAEGEVAVSALGGASPYALGAAVFGPAAAASRVAKTLRAGCVLVGDVIAPTADPRLPFGGAGESGFGTTRGAEGLLAMTRAQAIVTRARAEPRHLTRLPEHAAPLVAALLRLAYGRWRPGAVLGAAGALSAFARRREAG